MADDLPSVDEVLAILHNPMPGAPGDVYSVAIKYGKLPADWLALVPGIGTMSDIYEPSKLHISGSVDGPVKMTMHNVMRQSYAREQGMDAGGLSGYTKDEIPDPDETLLRELVKYDDIRRLFVRTGNDDVLERMRELVVVVTDTMQPFVKKVAQLKAAGKSTLIADSNVRNINHERLQMSDQLFAYAYGNTIQDSRRAVFKPVDFARRFVSAIDLCGNPHGPVGKDDVLDYIMSGDS